ncbi:unnamed protein product [Kluyveromyces dobzhanskii CBS 2104]|uniref:Protein SWT21 n=1 Tax=Kluyveromyces dobzhanskii CBS 2104 TaxID=1427455 RepID=A0A0A8L6A2_9SACH|nr:unnamed protein product [Kluyveromyces dobzhanskii CBS 2104]
MIASTLNCYHGSDCNELWSREEKLSQTFTASVEGYEFPKLHRSRFHGIERHRPVICSQITWSQDGTSICAVFDDFGVRQYLVPEDPMTNHWVPFTRWFVNSPIVSSVVHPKYSLYETNPLHQTILCASRDLPIRLFSLRSESTNENSLFHYSTVNDENEVFETPYAMTVLDDGNHFMTGSIKNKIAVYDYSRHLPIWQNQWTKQSCGKSSHKAIVSCFDECSETHDSIRFAGTYKTEVFRIDIRSSKTSLVCQRDPSDSWSNGIYQVIKSDNGHYLYCVKRNAKEIDVIDTRMLKCRINTLELPYKVGTQKFKASLNYTEGLLIGSYDGEIARWDRDCIEFGGLAPLQTSGNGIPPTSNILVSNSKARLNCVTTNPVDPSVLAVSTSSDKFADGDSDFETSIALIRTL